MYDDSYLFLIMYVHNLFKLSCIKNTHNNKQQGVCTWIMDKY